MSAVWDGYRLSSGAREILHGKVPDVIGILHRDDLTAGLSSLRMNVEGTGDDPELLLGPVDIYVDLAVPLCAILLLVAVRPSQSLRPTEFDSSFDDNC